MTVYLGRNFCFYVGSVKVAYGKSLSVEATAELIKEYSMDSTAPAVSGSGKQTYTWSATKIYDAAGFTLANMVAGTQFTITFSLVGSSTTAPYITLTNCTILRWRPSAGETGGFLLDVSGEAESMTETTS